MSERAGFRKDLKPPWMRRGKLLHLGTKQNDIFWSVFDSNTAGLKANGTY